MRTYYVRSTGEVIGPNVGVPRNLNNKKRAEFGNLFTSKKKALQAASRIRWALTEFAPKTQPSVWERFVSLYTGEKK